MKHVLVLGGGVGGTLVANLISRKLKKQIDAGEASVTVVDETGKHVYQPGFMYIAMGDQDPQARCASPSGACSTSASSSSSARSRPSTRRPARSSSPTARRLDYDELILATGSRIVPETIEHFEQEAHHFYSEEAAAAAAHGARRVHGRQGRGRHRPHALQVPAGAAGGRLPHRGRAARARPARARASCTTARPSGAPSPSSRSARWPPPSSSRRASSCTRSSTSRPSIPSARSSCSLEGEELAYDLLVLVPPHKGAQVLIDSGLAPRPGGWLPTDHKTLNVEGRENVWALGDATDLPLSARPAPRPTSRRPSSPSAWRPASRAANPTPRSRSTPAR